MLLRPLPILFAVATAVSLPTPQVLAPAPVERSAQDDGTEEEELDPETLRAREAVADLEKAVRGRLEAGIVSAILRNQDVVHEEVVAALAPLLGHRKLGVRRTAVEALRRMDHPDALEALHAFLEDDERLRRDADLIARTVRAIAWHGDGSSVPRLLRLPIPASKHTLDPDVLVARVRGLGLIRTRASVEALLTLLEGEPGWRATDFMADFRTSLRVLTGEDHGLVPSRWRTWWAEAGEELEIDPREPELAPGLKLDWYGYWGIALEGGLEHPRRGRGDRRAEEERRKREQEKEQEKDAEDASDDPPR